MYSNGMKLLILPRIWSLKWLPVCIDYSSRLTKNDRLLTSAQSLPYRQPSAQLTNSGSPPYIPYSYLGPAEEHSSCSYRAHHQQLKITIYSTIKVQFSSPNMKAKTLRRPKRFKKYHESAETPTIRHTH
jgi:hypothetical protein